MRAPIDKPADSTGDESSVRPRRQGVQSYRLPRGDVAPVADDDVRLTQGQAYEAAYRFVWQYMGRESDPGVVSLQEMLVAREPTADEYRTNDPASWADWLECVRETVEGVPLPRFRST